MIVEMVESIILVKKLSFSLMINRARGTAGLRGLEHPHIFAAMMFQIREVKEM